MLAMPVKDALGAELELDYSTDIINIRDILDATMTRRNIFVDSLELQKLTMQQIIHIRSYETDLATTIQWLTDLFNVLVKSHLHVGSQISELQHQKDELQTFLDTSKVRGELIPVRPSLIYLCLSSRKSMDTAATCWRLPSRSDNLQKCPPNPARSTVPT